MKFVTYNIRFSLGKDRPKDLTRIAVAVKGADVIALQGVMNKGQSLTGCCPDQVSIKIAPNASEREFDCYNFNKLYIGEL